MVITKLIMHVDLTYAFISNDRRLLNENFETIFTGHSDFSIFQFYHHL